MSVEHSGVSCSDTVPSGAIYVPMEPVSLPISLVAILGTGIPKKGAPATPLSWLGLR
jgi:hypothetical protein